MACRRSPPVRRWQPPCICATRTPAPSTSPRRATPCRVAPWWASSGRGGPGGSSCLPAIRAGSRPSGSGAAGHLRGGAATARGQPRPACASVGRRASTWRRCDSCLSRPWPRTRSRPRCRRGAPMRVSALAPRPPARGLCFVPLFRERFDLVMERRHYFGPPLQRLLRFARQPDFRGARQAAGRV